MEHHRHCKGCGDAYWTTDPDSEACDRCTKPFSLPAAYSNHAALLNALPAELRRYVSDLEDHYNHCPHRTDTTP